MASNGIPTTYAGLNQWKLSDKPGMEDFNEDNQKTDQKLYDLNQKLEQKANKGEQVTLQRYELTGANTSVYPSGIGGYFEKDEKGYVYLSVNGHSEKGHALSKGGAALGVLPEGFRPLHGTVTACRYVSGQHGLELGMLEVRGNGVIYCCPQDPRPEPNSSYKFDYVNGFAVFPTRRSN